MIKNKFSATEVMANFLCLGFSLEFEFDKALAVVFDLDLNSLVTVIDVDKAKIKQLFFKLTLVGKFT